MNATHAENRLGTRTRDDRRAEIEKRYFRRLDVTSDLKRRAVRGGGATIMSQVAGTAIQLVGSVVLARLLTPHDFGIVAMALTFSIFVHTLSLNGFIQAIVQSEEISHRQLSALFWIGVVFSSTLAVLFALCAPLLASFYGEPDVAPVARVLAVAIAVGSLPSPHYGLMQRNMEFGALAVIAVFCRALAFGVAIAIAACGGGYWALVSRHLVLPIVLTACIWGVCRWRPGVPSRISEVGRMISFTVNASGRLLMICLTRNLDKLLMGKFAGPTSLGFYKRAYDFFLLPVTQMSAPLRNVALSTFSRLRERPAEYRRSYLNAVSVLAFLGIWAGGLVSLTGRDVIRLVLGAKWEETGTILAFFGPGIGILPLYATHGWIHLSLGKPHKWLLWGLIEIAVAVPCYFIAAMFGPTGMAIGFVTCFTVLLGPAVSYAGRPVSLTARSVFACIWRYAVAAATAGMFCWALGSHAGPFGGVIVGAGPIVRVTVLTIAFSTMYVAFLMLLYRGPGPIFIVIKVLRHMLPSGIRRGAARRW